MSVKRENREFLLLAKVLDKSKDRLGGMLMSEKLDGVRVIWIPNARGLPAHLLPFANTEKDKKLPNATGLFSRYGKIIYAPRWFLDALPTDICLDGELWAGRQQFQQVMSTVKKHDPVDSEWQGIEFRIIDMPSYTALFQNGRINNSNFKKIIRFDDCINTLGLQTYTPPISFEFAISKLEKMSTKVEGKRLFTGVRFLVVHDQELLPFNTDKARLRLDQYFTEVTDDGGEGVMLRHPSWAWEPYRSQFLLKLKPELDSEAAVIGYMAGKGKHAGRLGSLLLRWNGIEFACGGFTDEERIVTDPEWAESHPGELETKVVMSMKFPIGSILTFSYRELTQDGIPKEARYLRKKHKDF